MKIFVLIPVFNRLHHTKRVLEALDAQTFKSMLNIIIIDDGSTDGTADYLASRLDVTTITGNGSLWWAGAMQKGIEYFLNQTVTYEDYVIFLNNDTYFSSDYVEKLISISKRHGGASIGSAILEKDRDQPLVSIGPRINLNKMAIWDLIDELSEDERLSPKRIYEVHALSGRGTLYPAQLFKTFGGLKPRRLPHYFADYELSMRFARNGVSLLVSTEATVWSPPVYGNDISKLNLWDKCFSNRSSRNVVHQLNFYLLVGSPLQRLTAPFWLVCFCIVRMMKRCMR